MRYLLDTHVWLWMLAAPERLGPSVRALLEDEANQLMLSAASSWEIAIKYSTGRLSLPDAPAQFVPRYMEEMGVQGLPVQHRHALAVAQLAWHHRDPFDRLLVAQAQVEDLPLVTADHAFDVYEVGLIRAD